VIGTVGAAAHPFNGGAAFYVRASVKHRWWKLNPPGGGPMSLAIVAALTGVCFAGAVAAITIGLR
jgi:hypothetical protein